MVLIDIKLNKLLLSFIKCIIFLILICFKLNIFSSELNFKDIVNFLKIPETNINGEVINEEIYFKYNTFVYSEPIKVRKKTNLQRFKEVSEKGKMVFNNKKGEFYILGENYNGEFVYNVYFPVDFIPETLPEKWEYVYYDSFKKSWEENCSYTEQCEYMKSNKLMFDKIDFDKRSADSYNLVEYNIIPNLFGLGRFRLNTPSTWKTMGIVTAKRRLKNGTIRDVIFKSNPMAVDASINSYVNVSQDLIMNELEDEKNIDLEFGAQLINLNKYTKIEHVKNIESYIYVNGEYVDKVCGSKIANVDKKISIAVSRDESLINGGSKKYEIEVKSFICTDFKFDDVMYDYIKRDFILKIAPKKLVPIKSIDLKLLYKKQDFNSNKDTLVVRPLVQTKITESSDSCGIIEKGRNIAIIFDYGVPVKYIDSINLYLNDTLLESEVLKNNDKYTILKINSINAKITIASWKYLREKCKSYFNIMKSDIGCRVNETNIIKVEVNLNINEKCYDYFVNFDLIDSYLDNINYKFEEDIINYYEINNVELL